MARTLKTYVTSVGFFDLAVAAPSMKAALEAWGGERNLFQHGYARETQDPEIIAAATAKPGVVLKRPLGSNGPFTENAALPKSLPADLPKEKTAKERQAKREQPKGGAKIVSLADERAARRAALAFEKEQARRERESLKEEAAKARERARREEAVGKAQTALEHARERHEKIMEAIEAERESLDRRAKAEEARWEREKERLEGALRSARD
jgi:colicin import membrane protein